MTKAEALNKLQTDPELKALCGPNWREHVKAVFEAAQHRRDEPEEILRSLAEACQQRAALKKRLDAEERAWLSEMLELAEDAASEIKALLGQMATPSESMRAKFDTQRRRAQLRRSGLLPDGSGH